MKPLPSTSIYLRRVLANVGWGLALILISLAVGMMGYHGFEGIPWIDAFLNASMILAGMGPVLELKTHGGKLFAGLYALYSGLAVLIIAGVMLAPAIHRFLHRFHLEATGESEDDDK